MKAKSVVERMCCACRRRSDRRELVRVVARKGSAEVDEKGNASGRGAYLHRRGACSLRDLRRSVIERALCLAEGSIADNAWEAILAALGSQERTREGPVRRVRLRLRDGS